MLWSVALPASAQVTLDRVTTSAVFERYSPGAGVGFSTVSELTVPTTVRIGLGGASSFVLSAGYAHVAVDGLSTGGDPDQSLNSFLDTEARLTIALVRDRLLLLVNGTAPTGTGSIAQDDSGVLGPLASDVLGFATTSFGAGGNVGLGVAGALPAGPLAVGYGVSYQQPFSFVPVVGSAEDFRPGGEIRVRTGLEGALTRRTYVRLAGVFSARQKDEFGGSSANGVGHRIVGYASIDRAFGTVNVTIYGFDIFRAAPRIEPTALGAALIPRGNLLATGGIVGFPLGRRASFAVRGEYRAAWSNLDSTGSNERIGNTLRFGGDLRIRFSAQMAIVAQGDGMIGDLYAGANGVNVDGYRAGLHLEWTR